MAAAAQQQPGSHDAQGRRAPAWVLGVVYANVALYAVCHMAQVPLLPYLVKSLGADTAAYGRLQSAFSLLQLAGGLVSGPLMDRYGARAVMLASLLASAASYGLTACATSMTLLYLSRLPTVFQHAVLAARVMVTGATPPSQRARWLAYVGVAYGVGFAVGPYLGGLLSAASLQTAARAAAVGSLVGAATVAALVPADLGKGGPAQGAAGPGGAAPAGPPRARLADILHVCRLPGVPSLLAIKALSGLAFALFQSTFSLVLDSRFHLDPARNGLVLSYIGAVAIAVQAGFIGWATRRASDGALVRAACATLVAAFGAYAACATLPQLLAVVLPMSAAGLLLGTVNTAQLTKAVGPSHQGTVLAVDMALGSAVRVVSPALGAALLASRAGFAGVGASAAALVAALLGLVACGVVQAAPVGDITKHE